MAVELLSVNQTDLMRMKSRVLNEVIESRAIKLVDTGRDDWGLGYFNNFHLWLPNPRIKGGRGKAGYLVRQFGHFKEPRKLHHQPDGRHSELYFDQSPEQMSQVIDLAIQQSKLSVARIGELQIESDREMDNFVANIKSNPDYPPFDAYQSSARQLLSYCFPAHVLLRAWGYNHIDLCG